MIFFVILFIECHNRIVSTLSCVKTEQTELRNIKKKAEHIGKD